MTRQWWCSAGVSKWTESAGWLLNITLYATLCSSKQNRKKKWSRIFKCPQVVNIKYWILEKNFTLRTYFVICFFNGNISFCYILNAFSWLLVTHMHKNKPHFWLVFHYPLDSPQQSLKTQLVKKFSCWLCVIT